MGRTKLFILLVCFLGALGFAYWKFAIPTHRVEVRSELIMLGDLDNDHRWSERDLTIQDRYRKDPSSISDDVALRLDMNQNGYIDEEDFAFLRGLVASGGDPYRAEDNARSEGKRFPRPREFYHYVSVTEYRSRPLWALSYPSSKDSVIEWLATLPLPASGNPYEDQLNAALYAEAVRLDQSWRKRQAQLLPIERDYAARKLSRAMKLFQSGERYELLLTIMELVEDAETLTVRSQPDISLKFLAFRDHLREVLNSSLYAEFKAGKLPWQSVLKKVSGYIRSDLGLSYEFETLGPPRNFSHLENYLQRTEWQYYKSTTRDEDFRRLINYAQHDPRYLKAVSRTSPKFRDMNVENHNLPMVLLFREALRINNGDKKKAIGLLDEAIRVPYAWVKTIPRKSLPSSLALDNFLLPGNKEDGADKSRHWNVFGGICIYKSPQEALDLALKREMQDLREDNYSEDGLREFFRDMISDLNGMYHVMSVNPDLLSNIK